MKDKDEEILKKAIEKAVKGGYDREEADDFSEVVFEQFEGKSNNQICYMVAFVFSHDFAKAFWGESKPIYRKSGKRTCLITEGWQFHLQQMVLEKEPLKYLIKFLKK